MPLCGKAKVFIIKILLRRFSIELRGVLFLLPLGVDNTTMRDVHFANVMFGRQESTVGSQRRWLPG